MRAHRDTDVIIVDFYFSDQRSSVTEDDKVRQSKFIYIQRAAQNQRCVLEGLYSPYGIRHSALTLRGKWEKQQGRKQRTCRTNKLTQGVA